MWVLCLYCAGSHGKHLVLALSYAVMYIEKSVDGLFALDIAPITLVGAYAWILFAIFYRPKKK